MILNSKIYYNKVNNIPFLRYLKKEIQHLDKDEGQKWLPWKSETLRNFCNIKRVQDNFKKSHELEVKWLLYE